MGIRTPAHTNAEQHIHEPCQLLENRAFSDNRPGTSMQLQQQQTMANSPQVAQLKSLQNSIAQTVQRVATTPNETGMPDNLKTGIESLSGISMDAVRVHYNSSKPAQLNAHAYAQGTDIHIAPGQEQHLPHEAWHVVQQAQGRVKPTMQMKAGVPVNDDAGLEHEADLMGARALQRAEKVGQPIKEAVHVPGLTAQLESANYDETQVEWATDSIGGDTVGVKMEAKKLKKSSLGKHANLKGSPPGSGQQSTLMSYLPTNPKLSTADKYIKGHLLNHNVGGPGKDFNMFPITASANKAHLMAIETTVKNWVGAGRTVDYTVEVSGIDKSNLGTKGGKAGSVSANFDCTASNDQGASEAKRVTSVLHQKSVIEEFSAFEGLGNTGVFAATYDWAVDKDDPNDLIWEVAAALSAKKSKNKDLLAEVLIAVVLFDDVNDISEEAKQEVSDILDYLKSDINWTTELSS